MRQFLMLLLLAIVGLVLIPQVAPAPKYASKKETVAMSAIEYSRKWEPFLEHRRSLVDDKDWNDLHDAYKSFHENNDIIITGHVVKIVCKEAGNESEILSIYLEGIDGTNEYGFKCNVYLEIDAHDAVFDFLGGIPQAQIKWVRVGDIVSVSYQRAGGVAFEGEMFCVNHNDWDNQKSRIDSRLYKAVREHAKEAIRYKNRVNSWWKENAADAKPRIYRVAEYNAISYDRQTAESMQRKLAKKIRRQYEDWVVSMRENYTKEKFEAEFNSWNIANITETLTTMRDQSFRIKVCGRKFTDVVEYKSGIIGGFTIPIPPEIGTVGYVWHWNPDDVAVRYGFLWTSADLDKEIIEFLDKYPLEDIEDSDIFRRAIEEALRD